MRALRYVAVAFESIMVNKLRATLTMLGIIIGVAPAWSPDGQHIVFLSNRADNGEAGARRIWVMDADGSNQRALPVDVALAYTYGAEQAVSWGPAAGTLGAE